MMEFFLPTRLLTGSDTIRKNAALFRDLGTRCLIVTGGSSAERSGALSDTLAALESQGIGWEHFAEICPNPTIESCVAGGHAAFSMEAQFILGIGGGSAMDAAKVIAASAANPELDAAGLYRRNWANAPLPVALIGTTAGTGSEVTPVAVITDTDGRKRSFRGEDMYAALAFGDPRYTESMPAAVTASTGVDALAHCLESCYCKTATDISRAFALEGTSLLLTELKKVADGLVPDREKLYNGSILGGMAISITGTAMPHNLGYLLTEDFGIPHGFACAVFLPAMLSLVPGFTDALAKRVGTTGAELTDLICSLIPPLDVALTEEQIESLLPRWENNASILKTVGDVTIDQIRGILTKLFVSP